VLLDQPELFYTCSMHGSLNIFAAASSSIAGCRGQTTCMQQKATTPCCCVARAALVEEGEKGAFDPLASCD